MFGDDEIGNGRRLEHTKASHNLAGTGTGGQHRDTIMSRSCLTAVLKLSSPEKRSFSAAQLCSRQRPTRHTPRNSRPAYNAPTGGIKKPRISATTAGRLFPSASNLPLRRNACHGRCFAGSSLKASVRADSASRGSGVVRLVKVARLAAASVAPSNSRARLKEQMS